MMTWERTRQSADHFTLLQFPDHFVCWRNSKRVKRAWAILAPVMVSRWVVLFIFIDEKSSQRLNADEFTTPALALIATQNPDDVDMKEWNGTILGPPHVSTRSQSCA